MHVSYLQAQSRSLDQLDQKLYWTLGHRCNHCHVPKYTIKKNLRSTECCTHLQLHVARFAHKSVPIYNFFSFFFSPRKRGRAATERSERMRKSGGLEELEQTRGCRSRGGGAETALPLSLSLALRCSLEAWPWSDP